jgi:hypothetical protein
VFGGFMAVNYGLGLLGDRAGAGWRDILQGGFGLVGIIGGAKLGVRALETTPRQGPIAPEAIEPGLESRGFRPPPGTRQIPEGIPDNWRIRPTKGDGGVRYYDPNNPGNAVRVMPGDPQSPFSTSRSPYVRWQQNGQALDANGNVVPKNTPDAHIPLQDFEFDPTLFP